MAWVTKITGAGASTPHFIEVGDDVVISLTKTENGAVKVTVEAPPNMQIVRRRENTDGAQSSHIKDTFIPK